MQDDDYNDERVQVTGVFKNLPLNTHLKFDVLFSYKTLYTRGDWAPERYNTTWGRNDMYTFVKLRDGADPEALAPKLPAIVEKYSPELAERERWLVLTKIDTLPADELEQHQADIVAALDWQGPVFALSSLQKQGTQALAQQVMDYLEQQPDLLTDDLADDD